MKSSAILFAFAGWLAAACAQAQSGKVQPVIGEFRKYKVQNGDTLFGIARRFDVGLEHLRRVNKLRGSRLKPGKSLIIPSLYILPRNPGTGIVLNVAGRNLFLLKDGKVVQRHAVAVGQPRKVWQTITGEYKVARKVTNPSWKPTKTMVRLEHIRDEIVPPGKENPLGDRWIGWSAKGYGFHSTTNPRSIGRAISHGCVRLYPESARLLYEAVSVGMPIFSVYEPVLIGRQGTDYFLTVFPDTYGRNGSSLAAVQKKLKAAAILEAVDPALLRKLATEKDGFPHRITTEQRVAEARAKRQRDSGAAGTAQESKKWL